MASEFKLSLTDINALFKIKYEKLSENVYNSANVLLGRVKKSYNFTGRKLQITVPQSFAGGVGSGSLPKASAAKYAAAEIEAKKVYAVVDIDRETIKASQSSEGAFVEATKEVVKKGVESFMRNMSRILFNDGSGSLGSSAIIDISEADAADSAIAALLALDSDSNVVVPIGNMKEANFEERDLVDVTPSADAGAGSSAQTVKKSVEIMSVDPDLKTITLDGTKVSLADFKVTAVGSTENDLVAAQIHMQGSEGNDPDGLKGVLQQSDRESGKSYNISHGRRWEATDINKEVAGVKAALTTDMLNEVMLKVKKKSGKSPNLIVCSYTQYEKLLNMLESQKQFTVNTRAGLKSKSGADISFSGIEFMSIDGAVGIFPERFVEDDTIYFLNDSNIHIYHRPDFGWFDDDGTVFLRKSGEDEYEARYGGYLEIYINPVFHGVLRGLEG